MIEKTTLKVRNAEKKIKFTRKRIELLSKWDAPKELQDLKRHCIATLMDRIVFLKENDINNVRR
jgi:hypothetical protein